MFCPMSLWGPEELAHLPEGPSAVYISSTDPLSWSAERQHRSRLQRYPQLSPAANPPTSSSNPLQRPVLPSLHQQWSPGPPALCALRFTPLAGCIGSFADLCVQDTKLRAQVKGYSSQSSAAPWPSSLSLPSHLQPRPCGVWAVCLRQGGGWTGHSWPLG